MVANLLDRLRDPVLLFALSCGLALGWLLFGLTSAERVDQVFAESGPIESASALFLVLSAVVLSADMIRRGEPGRWHLGFLVLAAAMRELDWDKAFTDSGLLSLRLYVGATPIGQKVAGGFVVTLLLWALLRLLRRDLLPWLAALHGGQGRSWLMAFALMLYAGGKTLDGLGRKLAGWGIELPEGTGRSAGRIEEGLELLAAILILQVVGLSLKRSASRKGSPEEPAAPV